MGERFRIYLDTGQPLCRLYGSEQATCYYGSFENPYKAVGVVDKGYDNIESRHTIHYVKGETDPRTENKLKTIPDGEIASVRLGNRKRW